MRLALIGRHRILWLAFFLFVVLLAIGFVPLKQREDRQPDCERSDSDADPEGTPLALRRTPAAGLDERCLQLGGLRANAALPGVTVPVVAQQQTALLAAGQTPALAPRPAAAGLGGNGSDDRAPRGLFIALATMVIGALAAGHVKVVQDRLAGVSSA